MKDNWYVIYTKSRCEKKVAAILSKRKIENYCPLNRVVKKWADRNKLIYEPLFTSYVFVRTPKDELYKVKQATTDIVNYVYWLGKPAVIKDEEIESIKSFLNEHMNVKLEKKDIRVSDRVRIIGGSLMNMEGRIASVEYNKVKVLLPSLGYMMIAEVKMSNIEIIDRNYQVRNMVS